MKRWPPLFVLACRAAAVLVLLFAVKGVATAQAPLLARPIWVYNNWSAYDELSDDVPLTEELAMRELDEVLRLRRLGVRFDYYMMDAFWFDPAGGYRTWRADSWPNGPDRWLAAVDAAGLKPGLWFSTNTLTHLEAAPQWRSSIVNSGAAMAMYKGGFLADFEQVLQFWYDRGVRIFKFDMADFSAAAPGDEGIATAELRRRNAQALHAALRRFRQANSEIVLVAFNGIVGDVSSARGTLNPFNNRWLDVFDSLYSGDPRPANAPAINFARSMDIYSDYMVRHFAESGVPLQRVDSTSVMLGDTGTNYRRKTEGWKGSALLMVAHGGWVNTVHGDLERLSDADGRWLARLQALYAPLQQEGFTAGFGGMAGDLQPYGFVSASGDDALYAVVNPAQTIHTLQLPLLPGYRGALVGGRVLFRDAGFVPALDGGALTLGPGQLALVGFGRYASPVFDLGIQDDIRIPRHIALMPADFHTAADENGTPPQPASTTGGAAAKAAARPKPIEATAMPPPGGDLRIIMQQRDAGGAAMRSLSHRKMGAFFTIDAIQAGRKLPVAVDYDRRIWTGISWAAGEIRRADITPGEPIRIRISSADPDPSLHLEARVYRVDY